MTDQTITSIPFIYASRFENVESYIDCLKSEVVPEGQCAWFTQLAAISESNQLKHMPSCDEESLKELILKRFNACEDENVDSDATYIKPYLLKKLASKLKTNPIHKAIINSRSRYNYYDLSGAGDIGLETSSSIYTGDTEGLRAGVAEMAKAWDHRNLAIQLSFVLPLKQEHWDHFNFDEQNTSEFLASSYGKLAMLSMLQVSGMTESFINAVLETMFPKSTDNASPIQTLKDRYSGSDLSGNCLTPEVQADIQGLMEGEDKVFTNHITPVIPRVAVKDAIKFNAISGMKYHHETGLTATENDLESIRNTMMFNMSVTGGIVITFNVPVINESVRGGRFSTPTLIVPEFWAGSIKANRPQNNKQDEVDTLPEEQPNESARQTANRVRKSKRIFKKRFEGALHDQTVDKSDKDFHYCYPTSIANR